MKEQKAEGTRQKAVKAKRSWFLLPTAFCLLPSAFLNPHSAIELRSLYLENTAKIFFVTLICGNDCGA
ncbi:MAG TPA: hypothetical protein VF791_20610 [Pyrinomonadaceae bacterium]